MSHKTYTLPVAPRSLRDWEHLHARLHTELGPARFIARLHTELSVIRFLVLSEADITEVTLDERTWVHLDGRMDLSRWNLC